MLWQRAKSGYAWLMIGHSQNTPDNPPDLLAPNGPGTARSAFVIKTDSLGPGSSRQCFLKIAVHSSEHPAAHGGK
jgi:hypothetical protein